MLMLHANHYKDLILEQVKYLLVNSAKDQITWIFGQMIQDVQEKKVIQLNAKVILDGDIMIAELMNVLEQHVKNYKLLKYLHLFMGQQEFFHLLLEEKLGLFVMMPGEKQILLQHVQNFMEILIFIVIKQQ